jgi:O-antigen/teichoic acid export membrane protein
VNSFVQRSIQSLKRRESFVLFSGTSVLVSTANLTAGVLMLRWVPPEYMGIWQSALFAMALCDITKFGILNGMNRELPYHMGRGQVELAHRAVATASAFMLISMLIGAVIFGALTWYHWNDGLFARIALVAAGVTWCAAYYAQYVHASTRSSRCCPWPWSGSGASSGYASGPLSRFP